MFLAVRALITFNAAHLNSPYERLPRMYEKRRELDLVPRRILVEPEKARVRGSLVSAAPIYIPYTFPRPFQIACLLFVFLLSPIASPFPAAAAETPYTRYNKSRSLNTILPYEILSCYISLAALTRLIEDASISLFRHRLRRSYFSRFFQEISSNEKNINDKKIVALQ